VDAISRVHQGGIILFLNKILRSPSRLGALTAILPCFLAAGASDIYSNGAGGPCGQTISAVNFPQYSLRFQMDGLQVASLEDSTKSTGATLFYFPSGAEVSFDTRGGSVASAETTLLEQGSYSNQVDGILFAGGSTMGLEAGDGVRRVIYRNRAGRGAHFDSIPSVPTAAVYDFGGRIHDGADHLVFPTRELGENLMEHLGNTFMMGRAGAGVCTTCNKSGIESFGGQGASFQRYDWGSVFTAVVVNASGNILQNGKTIISASPLARNSPSSAPRPKQNTTLSFLVTDVLLDRDQLKRLAISVHSGMARTIDPFHTPWDGDILFVASLRNFHDRSKPSDLQNSELLTLIQAGSKQMEQSIYRAVYIANENSERSRR